jgi:hypothetical protein
VLELCTLDADVGGLDACGVQLGLRLRDVALDGDAAVVAVGCDAERVFVLRDGVVEELLEGVVDAEVEVVECELGLQGEQDVLAIGSGGL